VAPAGACDCHAHVFAPLELAPMVPERGYTPPPASLEDFRAMHRVLGIERAVIVQPSVYGTDNRVTLEAIAGYGPQCRGVAVVDPAIGAEELAAMHRAGIRGVRFNLSFAGGLGLESLETIAAMIAPFGWHLQLLLDARELPELSPRLARLPVALVVDHMGHMRVDHGLDHAGIRALLDLVGSGRAWVKLSGQYRITVAGPPYADVAPLARALIAANPERAVWGTDWPHPAHEGPMPNDGDLLDGLLEWAPDEALRRAILADNPARLYGFDG
jgi:predicted TIM-barrel fold metal-dependent hydrolase